MYVFVMQLNKITINVGNHQNMTFHSKSLSIRAFRTEIFFDIIVDDDDDDDDDDNFPICYLGTRRRHSQIRKEDHYLPSTYNRFSSG